MHLQLTLIALAFRYSFTSVLSLPTNGIESSPQTHLSQSIHRRTVDPLEISHIREETSAELLPSIFSADGVVSYKGSFNPRPRVFTFRNGEPISYDIPSKKMNAATEQRQFRDEVSEQKSAPDKKIDTKTRLQVYSEEWVAQKLAPEAMIRFGEALRINNNEVYPLTAQSFDVLKALPSDLGWDEQQAKQKTANVLEWYRTNKVASLAHEQQEILDFNLAIANLDHRPWWTEDDMQAWQTTNMPWKTITQVGSILERKVEDSMSPEELNNVRNEILTVLDNFAAHNDIEEEIEGTDSQSRGAIAVALKQVTGANKASKSKTIYPEFDQKLKLIGPQPDEIKEIKIFLKNQNSGLLHLNKKFRVLVHMQLLLNGIPYDIAEKYAKAYKTVSAAYLSLATGGMDMLSAMKEILPRDGGGKIYHMATYNALKSFFADIYGPMNVAVVNGKASKLLRLNEKIIKYHITWMPPLGL
ncbi:uncharacterized protein MELLADRAFT_67692 [Melampsora larici-populina 98AG31]|uniref:Secreted protein n=1 Tax=Melampsora larici-populina (strain 98AG31 / pathotype 3-4-7) TaxID=747676 RepID=F4S428_MELLP|nr:uncharacterized protein MELLADRAFT_67692 [Melampsora larici-populina 98AG31]EGG00636.1 hypothetical protein MELLADRAFT_67692 [Melampsora larici-populina 98AG31]